MGNPAVLWLDGTLVLHGGIRPDFARLANAESTRQVTAALLAKSSDPKAIINDPMGPLWYRGLATTEVDDGQPAGAAPTPPLPPIEDQVAHVLAQYDARRIVIGHTPILSGIAVLYDGRLFRIDTGISAVYGGKPSYLDILDGTAIAHIVERSQPAAK